MRHSTQALPSKRVACDAVITQGHDYTMVLRGKKTTPKSGYGKATWLLSWRSVAARLSYDGR